MITVVKVSSNSQFVQFFSDTIFLFLSFFFKIFKIKFTNFQILQNQNRIRINRSIQSIQSIESIDRSINQFKINETIKTNKKKSFMKIDQFLISLKFFFFKSKQTNNQTKKNKKIFFCKRITPISPPPATFFRLRFIHVVHSHCPFIRCPFNSMVFLFFLSFLLFYP